MSQTVSIVGAGPTGLALAIMARRAGMDVIVYDANPNPDMRPRAVMVHARGLEILDDLGLSESFLSSGLWTREIAFIREDGLRFEMDFSRIETTFAGILNIRQPVIERILACAFLDLGGVIHRGTAICGVKETTLGVELDLVGCDGTRDNSGTDWLFGCDGARSTIRKAIGATFSGFTIPYTYVLGEGYPEVPPPAGASSCMIISKSGVVSWLPFEDGTIRVAGPGRGAANNPDTRTAIDVDDRGREELTESGFLEEQAFLVSDPRYRIGKVDRTALYRVHSRIASFWGRGRIWLAGDAAHVHPPAGGQALNLGLADAQAIVMRLQGTGTPPLDFASYEAERRVIAEATLEEVSMMGLVDRMRKARIDSEIESILDELRQKAHRLSQIDTDYLAVGRECLGRLGDRNIRAGRRLPSTIIAQPGKGSASGWLIAERGAELFWLSADRHVRRVTADASPATSLILPLDTRMAI